MTIKNAGRTLINNEKGAALILAIIAVTIMAIMGGTFAMLVQNEARSIGRGTAYDQALYVAESGIEDVLYQRSKNQSNMCFPFTDDGTITGVSGVMSAAASSANCDDDQETDADVSDADNDEVQCWPYNETLYANVVTFGPNFYCHDGSNTTKCPTYQPLMSWPAQAGGGGIGWKDMDPAKTVPLPSAAQSSGQRYTTGLFTVCSDDFVGDNTAVEPAKSAACATPPCNRRVTMLSIVSIGEVQTKPGEVVQRAVKVDITPAALYSGTIDKYVDLTMMYQTDINGPIHINGWWDPVDGASVAFLLFTSASVAPIFTIFDPPELVSVSYGEDPANPDWQPPLGLSKINYVHLPVRIDIPQVNWRQFEDRMDQLYADALDMYGAGQVRTLRRENYNPSNMYDNNGLDGTEEFNCYGTLASPSVLADAGAKGGNLPAVIPGMPVLPFPNGQYCQEATGIMDLNCRGPLGDRRCCVPNTGDTPTGVERIHNCNSDEAQQWENVAFDLYDLNSASYVSGPEPGHLGGGNGPRDRSLRFMQREQLTLEIGLGCFTDPMSCIYETENRPEFTFMGKHEFNGKVFIDGTMGIGTRTPFHTCGEGDGSVGLYCLNFGIDLSWIPDPLDFIPDSIEFRLGLPHWHVGDTRIRGEVLVNGKAFISDYFRIDGGTLYSDDSIVRDETSGINLEINLNALIKDIVCLLFTGACSNAVIQFIWENIIFPIFDLILQSLFPWWPTITVRLAEVFIDINGARNADHMSIPNPGTIYTRGNFFAMTPSAGWTAALLNQIMGMIFGSGVHFLNFVPALDPVRIWNYGAIVAGGTEISPGVYRQGNIYFSEHKRNDILIQDPDHPDDNTNPTNTGYVFARGSLVVKSDIISKHTNLDPWDLFSLNTCNAWLGADADCAAKGIFYSGGATAGHENEVSMFSSDGGSVSVTAGDKQFETKCINPHEPSFFTDDPLGQITCWAGKIPLVCNLYGNCDKSEFNIRGYVFAGQVGAMPMTYFRLDQDTSVLHKAVERRYYRSLSGAPVDWMEIEPPANVPRLN